MKDKLRDAILKDCMRVPNFLDTTIFTHKAILKDMTELFTSLLIITDKKRNKMVFMTEEEIDYLLDIINHHINYIYSHFDIICTEVDEYIYKRLRAYKRICIENEYYEYLKTIDSLIKLYVL